MAITGGRASEGGAVLSEITAAGGKALFVTADLTQTETTADVISRVVSNFDRLNSAFQQCRNQRRLRFALNVKPSQILVGSGGYPGIVGQYKAIGKLSFIGAGPAAL